MSTITDYLIKIQDLTQQNLDILKTINDSFFTNKSYLKTSISGVDYTMPSFISLENKINALREDFENLVNAPKTGEAFFTLDGSTRAIEVRGYSTTPPSLELKGTTKFGISENNIFKDFLTPVPYINFDLNKIPNDITSVVVKKVIPYNENLVNEFKTRVGTNISLPYTWGDMYKILSLYTKGDDYVEYDTIMKMPIRTSRGLGYYVVEQVINDSIDENLDEYLELKLRTDIDSKNYSSTLSYKDFDETIEKMLKVGDKLLTYDDSAKLEIVEIQYVTNIIKVKVVNGEYLNLMVNATDTDIDSIPDNAKLKFFSSVDFENDKYIHVPLEEDQYIFIAIAPLNDRMNVQAPWGSGLLVDAFKLTNENENFETYYKENVRNIGDALNDLTGMMSEPLTKLNQSEYKELVEFKPTLTKDDLEVVQINSHLNTNETVKNIRTLYSQKKALKTQLDEIQSNIDSINDNLSRLAFDDTTNMRSIYTNQLNEYNKTKNELNTSISKIVGEISMNVNESEIPIENAKYHIRGFCSVDESTPIRELVVQYRYKNLNNASGKAMTINSKLFTDWNTMVGVTNKKTAKRNDGRYTFELSEINNSINEPMCNQIDIPISQGESVDIRVKIVYDYGWPFVEISSDWSDIINIQFPTEFLKDVQILDIIEENNNDIETNRFNNIIKEAGITDHVNDKIVDQDITYYHNPSHIASGFYTSERRVIPLKDKLEDLTNIIAQLQDEVLGTSSEQLDVYLTVGEITKKLVPFQTNYLYPKSYSAVVGSAESTTTTIDKDSIDKNPVSPIIDIHPGLPTDPQPIIPTIAKSNVAGYLVEDGNVYTTINIVLKNNSAHSVKLYPIFPGDVDNAVFDLKNTKFTKGDYSVYDKASKTGNNIFMKYDNYVGNIENLEDPYKTWETAKITPQNANQFITFRLNNPYNGAPYYGTDNKDQQSGAELPSYTNDGAVLYPHLTQKNSLSQLDSIGSISYKLLNPGESITIPLEAKYKLSSGASTSFNRTMSFDLRTSLYRDFMNYTFTVVFTKVTKVDNDIYSNNAVNEYNVVI